MGLVVVAMAKSPETRKYDLSSVRKIVSGAAPLGREVSSELEKVLEGRVNLKASDTLVPFFPF